MDKLIQVVALTSFFVALIPNLLNALMVLGLICGVFEPKSVRISYGLFVWLALLVWPIAYWCL
jgi:hypothetical protein